MLTLSRRGIVAALILSLSSVASAGDLVRSARSGPWSAPATWEVGKLPVAGSKVQVRAGHTVRYDVQSAQVIRSLHLAGTLTFASDRDTRLDVGLIRIQAGDSTDEEGFATVANHAFAGAPWRLRRRLEREMRPALKSALIAAS